MFIYEYNYSIKMESTDANKSILKNNKNSFMLIYPYKKKKLKIKTNGNNS